MPQTRVVRSYGLYHPTYTAGLALCRAQLGQPPVVVPVGLDWQTVCAQRGDAHPERCPTCGQLLVCTGVIPRGGAPPPPWLEEQCGMRPHSAGKTCQGRRVPWGQPGEPPAGGSPLGRSLGLPAGGATSLPSREGPGHRPVHRVGGRRVARHCNLHSVRRHIPGQAASGRGQVQTMLSEVLRARA